MVKGGYFAYKCQNMKSGDCFLFFIINGFFQVLGKSPVQVSKDIFSRKIASA